MSSIPRVQSDNAALNQFQSLVLAQLNPLLARPLNSGVILKDVDLVAGSKKISHTLNRVLQGWFLVRNPSGLFVYDDQDNNTNPELTLTLIADAPGIVNVFVF